jgi:PadR family transcriptional regulator, regulatory protein PadR
MTRSRALSNQAHQALALLADAHPDWLHGYDLMKASGVKSGTLYPLLMRLETQGYLEAQWQESSTGRPPRHVYRLTPSGLEMLRQSLSKIDGPLPSSV